jgi:dTMP kinase
MSGLFITVEGIDGAGKTTHLEWLGEYFTRRRGRSVVTTREPGGTPLGEAIRELLLNSDCPINAETEALLMFAARREHLDRIILPALAAGHVVLSDRFTDATFAYQGWGRGVSLARLKILEEWVQGDLKPDLTLYFDVPVHIGRERLRQGRPLDRFEREQADFFERVRYGYADRAARDPHRVRVIDSSRSVADVEKEIEDIVSSY